MLIALFATASHGQFPTDPDPDSLNIEFVGQINLTGEPVADRLPDGSDLYVSGDIALMGDFRGIVHIVDISDPTAMREIAQVRTPGPARPSTSRSQATWPSSECNNAAPISG